MKIKFWKIKQKYSLIELDELYRTTVINLSVDSRIQYLTNFIERCKLDLKIEDDGIEKENINQLINAAKKELKSLS